MAWPETFNDTVEYDEREVITPANLTLRLIDGSRLDLIGRVFLNGVEITASVGTSDPAKVDKSTAINTTPPLQGGGDLSSDRTLSINNFTDTVKGTVPAPVTPTGKYLRDNGTWDRPEGTGAVPIFTASVDGLVPKPVTSTGKYLKDDASWATVSGGGLTDGDKGDITVGSGGTTLTIDSAAVTNGKLADMSANSFKARQTSIGTPQDLSVGTVKTMLALDNVTNTSDANKPVSTAQQAALDLKLNLTRTMASKSGAAVTAALGDAGTYMRFTTSNPTFTIPPNATVAFPIGTIMEGTSVSTAMTIAEGAGVLISKARTLVTAGILSGWTIIKTGTNTWDLHGDFV